MSTLVFLVLAYLAFVVIAAALEVVAGLAFILLGAAGLAIAVLLVRSRRRLAAGRDRAKR